MKTNTDPIQNLIDGRLGHAERRALLREIDSTDPSRWRDLALGFVEKQVLGEAFAEDGAAAAGPAPQKRRSVAVRLWALAACVAAGVFVGMLLPLGAPAGGPALPAAAVPAVEGSSLRYGTLNLAGAAIPVVDASTSARDAGRALQIASGPLRALSDRFGGQETSLKTTFVTAELEGGRRLVIPVRRVSFSKPQG